MQNLKTLKQLNKFNEVSQKELIDTEGGRIPIFVSGPIAFSAQIGQWVAGWFK